MLQQSTATPNILEWKVFRQVFAQGTILTPQHGMGKYTQEQVYETSLNSTILLNVIITLVFFVLFPFARKYIPSIFAPLAYQERVNVKYVNAFWFIDVFRQPLSVYATRGNLATIFAVFNIVLLLLYGFISILTITCLVPTYYYGTDQSWNTNYLTFYSKITIPHLERNSIMNLIPIFTIIVVTAALLFCYHQFTLIYVFFRQRLLRR